MRKTVSIFLLCCLIIYIGGYHLVYLFYQYNLKQEMRAYLQTHTDQRFGTYLNFPYEHEQVKEKEFEWEEENEEFSYRGEKYDVVSVKVTGHTIQICALKDERENSLDKEIAQIRHNQQSGSSHTVFAMMKFFPAFHQEPQAVVSATCLCSVSYLIPDDAGILTQSIDIHSPPPRAGS